jgi:hypothetical protein
MLVTIPIHKKAILKIVKIPNLAQKQSFPPLCATGRGRGGQI